MKVTSEQLDFYKEEGYIVIEGALTDADLEPLIQAHIAIVDEIARDLHRQGKVADLYEEEPFETRLARLADQCDEVDGCPDIGNSRRRETFDFLRNRNLVDVIEPFIGPEISCNPVSHVRPKMPATDVAFHQDAVFTTQEAKDILQVTVWLPLVEATEENGCLQVQPRVHQQRMVYWTYSKGLPQTEKIFLPMQKGDVLIMHKLTPHGSGPNNTDAVRWSMDLRYQQTGEPSPRPEWPNLIARSRRDPNSETVYEDWRDQWAAALEETPAQLSYPRPNEPLPFKGEMFLA
jgi:ectoine hydroxylase-related dioxygenase (phytanoyl-CoA dioxygenase family)